MKLPLEGIIVLEFSQFLAAPSAGLRLADLGARVIKIERPNGGDAGRSLPFKNLKIGSDSLLFHTINRNKESFSADLKNKSDLEIVKKLIGRADVITHNFRPGVMEKIGLDYNSVKIIKPDIIYAEVTGYGKTGPWKDKPGQDLLIQSMSGLAWLSGNSVDTPQPFGLSIADIFCGAHLAQGILAALVRRKRYGIGALVEVSLLESTLDFQFEFITTLLNGGGKPKKSLINHAHSLLSAPYGIYQTKNGYLSLAMCKLHDLANAIHLPELLKYTEEDIFKSRDEIKKLIANHFLSQSNNHWLPLLSAHKIWAMPVWNWNELRQQAVYNDLAIEQSVQTKTGETVQMMRGPVRIKGEKLYSSKPAPLLGEHTEIIKNEMGL